MTTDLMDVITISQSDADEQLANLAECIDCAINLGEVATASDSKVADLLAEVVRLQHCVHKLKGPAFVQRVLTDRFGEKP